MGEYAKFKGEEVKIGTCENMYYLRADQRHLVTPLPNSVDPVRHGEGLRFRFPFPDEDHIQPGAFESHERRVSINGVRAPDGAEHYSVQFVASAAGYVLSIPCPEGAPECTQGMDTTVRGIKVFRNGFCGAVHLAFQKLLPGGVLCGVFQCGPCGAMWRAETLEDCKPYIDALIKQGKSTPGRGDFYLKIAERLEAGYRVTP